MKFLVLALFVVSALAEPEADAEAESRYLGSYQLRAGQRYYGRPGFYGHGGYNGAYKTYNNYAVFPQSYMSAYNTPYFGYNQYNQYRSQYNRIFKREAEAEPEAEPEAEAEADAQYYGNYGQFQGRHYNRYNQYNRNVYSAYTMSPYSAYTTPFSAYRAVPSMMHQTRFYGTVPHTAYNMRFKREAEAEAEAEPEAEAEADAQYYGNYGQFQRRNYNGYNRYTMSPYQYAYGNLPGGFGGYNQNRVYGNNYGYGYNRYNQQGPYRSYYGYRG